MKRKATVLLVADTDTEELLARRAIQSAGIDCNVHVAEDGAEACRFLFENEDSRPELVLLDLNVPTLNGFEVLQRIRGRERTRHIPVVMLTSAEASTDAMKAHEIHANSYVEKTDDQETYDSRLKLLLYYWLGVNQPSPLSFSGPGSGGTTA